MPSPASLWLSAVALSALPVAAWSGLTAPDPGGISGPKVRYTRDIRPILADRCFACHGPDEAARKAGMRLDDPDAAIKAGRHGSPIVPRKPDQSLIMRRIVSANPDQVMPPPDSHKKAVSPEERELIRRWIEQGAVYESHWAFAAPARPDEPQVSDASWCRTPIDRFILRALDEQGIKPAEAATPHTLVRRVYLDLTGLPPTPEEIRAFVSDTAPDAYEQLVDRLLTQEPYRTRTAERLAAVWLDAARYADTCGIHTDGGRQMWLWRDWVLNAFRDNMPYDRFITEQLAGDLIDNATDDQKVASGFNRNHVTTDEGGAIPEEYLVEYGVDRASTTASVLLGLSMGCARCHDHKYDPITTKDFYSFYSFFNSIEEPGLYSQTPNSNRAYEPFLAVPSPAQRDRLAAITKATEELKTAQATSTPDADVQRGAFLARLTSSMGLNWLDCSIASATSKFGATLTPQPDGSVLASGVNPPREMQEITLSTPKAATGPRLLLLEALTDPSLPFGRVGRAPNGNAMLTGIEVHWAPVADPGQSHALNARWVWADRSQMNGDYNFTNALLDEENTDRGWAVDAHNVPGSRQFMLLADEPMGDGAPVRVTVQLKYRSIYENHTFGRVRLSLATCDAPGVLPIAQGNWHLAGPFAAKDRATISDENFGPEAISSLDLGQKFGPDKKGWMFDLAYKDSQTVTLPAGLNVDYLARTIFAAEKTAFDVSLGSDDGWRLFVNGREVAKNKVERSVMPDQDKAHVELAPGKNVLVLEIVNTGGEGGYYYRAIKPDSGGANETNLVAGSLPHDLVPALFPDKSRAKELDDKIAVAWKIEFSPAYREQQKQLDALGAEQEAIDKATPRTMVMKEVAMPRETFVLTRGQYDKPDRSKPVQRAVPVAFGSLPAGAPSNRLGLAQWMLSPQNPLASRVAVNRLWQTFFGNGLVRTSEDFGQQGEWPSHPELLDWLAVDYREHGWDTRRMIRLMVTSAVYRQSSAFRPDVRQKDPENRLLASYPRRRLSAEQIRDAALASSGLLVEKLGGPSVKPYQPDGLWQEVAMLASNTREYKAGTGDDLWRRSLYTYWKRACPPPSLQIFDAPTREFCVVRRANTSTPLQALVLWNDPQYVEAARVLAARVLGAGGTDETRLAEMYTRCVGNDPDRAALNVLSKGLAGFRDRFRTSPEDAAKLLMVGASPLADNADKPELAAWTMMASTIFNLYQATTQE
jgi:mono/diheme cytochrome c family protein